MKKLTLEGFIAFEFTEFTEVKLVQSDGYRIDLIGRFKEVANSYPKAFLQVNYWLSNSYQTKDEILKGLMASFYGELSADYETENFSGSSMTGSWTERISTLEIGGHDLIKELRDEDGRFIIIELNIA